MCDHPETVQIDGSDVCCACGQIFQSSSFAEEWNYEQNNVRSGRCQGPKRTRRDTVDADLFKMNIPSDIRKRAVDLYITTVGAQTRRSKQRKGLYATVIHRAYAEAGNKITPDEVCRLVGVSPSALFKGVLWMTSSGNSPTTSVIESDLTCAESYIPTFLKKMSHTGKVEDRDVSEVKRILHFVWEREDFSDVKPQALAAAVVFYYLRYGIPNRTDEDKPVTKSDFATKISMTESVISRVDSKLKRIFASAPKEE